MIVEVAQRLKETKEYYFSRKLSEIADLRAQGKDIINIAIGNPDMPPSDETISSLIEHVQNKTLHGYPPYRGLPEFRSAISHWYDHAFNVKIDPETEVLPLIGSKEGITHISLAFLDPGDEVLVPELGYPSYRTVTTMIGGKAIPYPMDEEHDWQPDFEAISKLDLRKVKLMWLNYPHMPTGTPASHELFEQFVAFAHKHKILLCHDNPYSLILNTDKPLSLLNIDGAKEVALELNSMSKSHNMAGWRLGWIAGKKEYLDQIIKIKTNVDTGMFKPLQLAAAKALQNPDSWHEARNEVYKKRRLIIEDLLKKLNCTFSSRQTGMFMWARLPEGISAEAMVDHLLHKHYIFVAPGFIFGPKGKSYIRASLCVPEALLEKALKRLEKFDPNNL